MLKDPSQRGLARIVNQSQDAQAALGDHLARNTLANALCQRDLEQMIEAWALLLAHYSPYLARAQPTTSEAGSPVCKAVWGILRTIAPKWAGRQALARTTCLPWKSGSAASSRRAKPNSAPPSMPWALCRRTSTPETRRQALSDLRVEIPCLHAGHILEP